MNFNIFYYNCFCLVSLCFVWIFFFSNNLFVCFCNGSKRTGALFCSLVHFTHFVLLKDHGRREPHAA